MMTASELATGTPLATLLDGVVTGHVPDVIVSGIGLDSRSIVPGDLFLALAGTRSHGLSHVDKAIKNGAAAILYEPSGSRPKLLALIRQQQSIPVIEVDDLQRSVGLIAGRFFNHPSESLDVVGITGTNGKTSCTHFLSEALGRVRPCAVIGTLGWGYPGHFSKTENTTPSAVDLHYMLSSLRGRGAKVVAVEVSSHGLVQGRTNGVRFCGAVITNIRRDHLDYHGTIDAYIEAKLALLRSPGLGFVVFNADDPNAGKIVAEVPDGVTMLGFSRTGKTSAIGYAGLPVVCALNICHQRHGLDFAVELGGERAMVHSRVLGDFNVENLLATIATLLAMGFTLAQATQHIASARPVPGRMERHGGGKNAPTVVIDYAHTPDALDTVLRGLREHCRGRLWSVFGCGGNRDRGKRAQMGAIAAALADRVIITDDNPRDEDGDAIAREILAGCDSKAVSVVRNRAAAIETAIRQAAVEDVVLVAGKGHEISQEIAGVKQPFSDAVEVRRVLLACVGNEPRE